MEPVIFTSEEAFENSVIDNLRQHGWGHEPVLRYPTEEDLVNNWANILFKNNNEIDRLNGQKLTPSEMQQIIDQLVALGSPLARNAFINGKTLTIKRDNPNDVLHYGKEVSLKIFDQQQIAAGQSVYQIVQQPKFNARNSILPNRRGDLMLLINGMPVIHIELKKSNVAITQAVDQIRKYMHEGVFTKIFSLVQIFVAMNPAETVYFANPGTSDAFNPSFQFHWGDFNNNPVNDYREVISSLLSIPMAHQLVGFYTIADGGDGVLKVMRSYQFNAAQQITSVVRSHDWKRKNQRGGYIWHTTGSGKTMTSFKSAQLIADSGDADKVFFIMDRIELGVQSLNEYRNFAGGALTEQQRKKTVRGTEDTGELRKALTDKNYDGKLIVTSIQKMDILCKDRYLTEYELEYLKTQRIVFIIDECHRSTFGDMLSNIKDAFPYALFFGFTGTPIQLENEKKNSTTATLFGNELHRYSIADGIRDGNVLGFHPYKVSTFKEKDLRENVCLMKVKAKSIEEMRSDSEKSKMYDELFSSLPMCSIEDAGGNKIRGIEDEIPASQYNSDKHRRAVVEDILDNWDNVTNGGKFHAMLATSSIPEAIEYYRLFKEHKPTLKVALQVDANIDNEEGAIFKEDGLVESLSDYNRIYNKNFKLGDDYGFYRKDVAARLSHKDHYTGIQNKPEEQLNLLIVVSQMLTGFDSKWVNTLFLDKILVYENIIQAFSRTNRLFNKHEKPFGTIRYYRKPNTMEKNIEQAFDLYSGNRPKGLFVDNLDVNLCGMDQKYLEIQSIFETSGIPDFGQLPESVEVKGKFAKTFREFCNYLEAAKIQGFRWDKLLPSDYGYNSNEPLACDEQTYLKLVQRYKELSQRTDDGKTPEYPFDIDTYITEIRTEDIDSSYMDFHFNKWLLAREKGVEEDRALQELHQAYTSLSQEDQKYADVFISDIQSGSIDVEPGKSFRDYVTEYRQNAENQQLNQFCDRYGIDKKLLVQILSSRSSQLDINEFGRFDKLKKSADFTKTKAYFEDKLGHELSPIHVNMNLDRELRAFIKDGVMN